MSRTNAHMTGMHGVFLVAAKLSEREYIVSPTARNAPAADLLVASQDCERTRSVQVKTNSGNPNFWLVGSKSRELKSSSHLYVFVNLADGDPRYYVVPSTVVAKQVQTDERPNSTFYSWSRDEEWRDRWDLFEESARRPVASAG